MAANTRRVHQIRVCVSSDLSPSRHFFTRFMRNDDTSLCAWYRLSRQEWRSQYFLFTTMFFSSFSLPQSNSRKKIHTLLTFHAREDDHILSYTWIESETSHKKTRTPSPYYNVYQNECDDEILARLSVMHWNGWMIDENYMMWSKFSISSR